MLRTIITQTVEVFQMYINLSLAHREKSNIIQH